MSDCERININGISMRNRIIGINKQQESLKTNRKIRVVSNLLLV